MSELLIPDNEKENENFEYYNNIIRIKDTIKSDIIKKMLEEEDNKIKEEQNIDNKNIINNNSKKKKFNNEKINIHYPLIKIQPKSKTIKYLLQGKSKRNILKIKKNNKTKDKNETIINNKNKTTKASKKTENKNEFKNEEPKNIIIDNIIQLKNRNNSTKRYLSPEIQKQKNIIINEYIKDNEKNELYHSEEKTDRKSQKFFIDKEIVIKKEEKNLKYNEKIIKAKNSIYNEINQNLKNIYNNNDVTVEKSIKDFEKFLTENDSFETNYSPNIQKTLKLFKKGNKFIKKYIYLPNCPKYTNEEIVKNLLFKDILSFLSPIEKYVFSKTNKDSLINYMKTKGAETENLLDKYNKQKEEIEKILNKNQNIKVTKENFFNDNRLSQIFNLLDDSKYLEIFNDKSKVPDDSIIFVFKLFFLLIKGTDKLIELKNDIFWEKISTYFINNTNEFNQNDYLLGELIKKILEQKLDFSESKIQKIHEIIEQVDLRQINPNTFKDSSPTTAQFCFIIGYFMEFFGIIDKDWNPLEIEYKELNQKINELIKKINKIGLYIVNLKYKSQFK